VPRANFRCSTGKNRKNRETGADFQPAPSAKPLILRAIGRKFRTPLNSGI
jgi:hypothetical protein